jgi:GT2 family glycosyltransferase
MDLSIIIPSYNTKNLLDRCVSSIIKSLERGSTSYEIIVVDNHSTDGSVELLKKNYKTVKTIVNEENIGYGRANNQAIRLAKGDYILLLNSDISVKDDAIEQLVTIGRKHAEAFVGGKLLNEDNSPQASCGPFYTLPVVFGMLFAKGDALGITRYSPGTKTQVDWVSGACLGGTKAAFCDVGLFDESIFMYMEEIDFLYRAKIKGYTTLFYPASIFVHTGAASSGQKRDPVINIYRGLIYFYTKHRSIIELEILRSFLFVKAVLAILIGKLRRDTSLVMIYEKAYRMVI